MPVRSSNSSVFVWPEWTTVDKAVRQWVREVVAERPDLVRIGYFGSYARGDWGPGSDLDLVIVIDSTRTPFSRRGADWDTSGLPVPTDLLVYTREEWSRLNPNARFTTTLRQETIWIFERT